MGKESTELGKQGEITAEEHLIKLGYKILERNYHSSQGEIDIIALDGEFLVFIEVKNYSFRSFGSAVGAIGKSKKRSMIHAARTYLMKENIKDKYCRFDVMAISRRFDGSSEIELIKDAFQIN